VTSEQSGHGEATSEQSGHGEATSVKILTAIIGWVVLGTKGVCKYFQAATSKVERHTV